MSRQIQIRRGTADQHKTFTGAQGELTMDTTNNTLRLHDGATPGGVALARADAVTAAAPIPDNYDFVIESWISADNNTWYRKYKSGWVEQGGYGAFSENVLLPVEMTSTDYLLFITPIVAIGGTGIWTEGKTINSFKAIGQNYGAQYLTQSVKFNWFACGYRAS